MGTPGNARDPHAHDVLAFAADLRRRHVRGAALGAAYACALVLAIPALVVAWWLPGAWLAAAVAGAACLAIAAASAAWTARRVAANALLPAATAADGDTGADPRLVAELGDELTTWLERPAAASPMRAWLLQDVWQRLPSLPPRALAQVGRRRLGWLLWLLPIALLLLIAWFLAAWLAPPWAGAFGGRPDEPEYTDPRPPNSSDGDPSSSGGSAQPKPDEPRRPDGQPPAPPPPPPTPSPSPQPQAEPAPLLTLPSEQRIVTPEFVGDGPTRRARMHVAEVGQGGAAAPAATARPERDQPTPVPPPRTEEFARAAEAALAARHVPPDERAMVRRYFDALQKVAK